MISQISVTTQGMTIWHWIVQHHCCTHSISFYITKNTTINGNNKLGFLVSILTMARFESKATNRAQLLLE